MINCEHRSRFPALGSRVLTKALVLEVLVLGMFAVPVAAQLDSAAMTVGYRAQSLDGERFGYVAPSFDNRMGSRPRRRRCFRGSTGPTA